MADLNQHLKDMFPAAFAPNIQIESEDTEMQPTLANDEYEANDNDGTLVAAPPRSPVSQSQGYGSEGDSDYSNDSDETIDHEIQPRSQPRRLTITEIKAEYSQHYIDADADVDDDEPDVELHADNDYAISPVETNDSRRKSPKRKNSDVLEQPAAKRVTRASRRVDEDNSEIIIIDDDHVTERPSTSSQNHDEESSTINDGNLDRILNENDKIVGEIRKWDKSLKALKAEKAVVVAKFKNRTTANFDMVMVENDKIVGEIAECEQNKEELMAQKATIEAKLRKYLN